MATWRRNYDRMATHTGNKHPRIWEPYSHKRKAHKRLRRGKTSVGHQITNKGDMHIKIPKNDPEPSIGRLAFRSDNTRQPGTLVTYRIGSAITKGSDVGQRQGDTTRILGFNFRVQVYNNNTNAIYHGKVRCLVCHDRKPTASAGVDMFCSETATNLPIDYAPAAGADSFRLIKPINQMRYHVLYDKTFDAPITSSEDQNQLLINEYIPMNYLMKYNDAAPGGDGVVPRIQLMYFIENEDNTNFTVAPLFKVLYITHFMR